jgi:hypothetical protein
MPTTHVELEADGSYWICMLLLLLFFHASPSVKIDIGHPVSKGKFRTLVKVNLGRRTSR